MSAGGNKHAQCKIKFILLIDIHFFLTVWYNSRVSHMQQSSGMDKKTNHCKM